MGLPLPRVVADVGPGGPLVTAMSGMNALQKQMLENQYYGPKTEAQIKSQTAYANAVAPQFLAKLMGHEDILANMTEEQKRAAIPYLYNVGTNNPTGNNSLQMQQQIQSGQNGLFPSVVNGIKNIFGYGQKNQQPQPNQQNDPLLNNSALSPQDRAAIIQQRQQQVPGSSYVIQGNQPIPQTNQGVGVSSPGKSFAQNTGELKLVKAQGEETGKQIAKQGADLDDAIEKGYGMRTTLDELGNVITSPEAMAMRQLPLAGRHEFAYYAKEGTPQQQKLVGRFYDLTGRIVTDMASNFKGMFRAGEQRLIENMKASPSDTIDTMLGKVSEASYMNDFFLKRASATRNIMDEQHITKTKALEIADKQMNGDEIRKNVHNKLNPKPTDDEIEMMAKKYKISSDEVKKRLKAKGII